MTVLLTPRTSQPQGAIGIDWSNPLCRGLSFVSVGDNPRNLVSGEVGTIVGTVNKVVEAKGRALRQVYGANNRVDFAHKLDTGTSEYSFGSVFSQAYVGQFQYLILRELAGVLGGDQTFLFGLNSAAGFSQLQISFGTTGYRLGGREVTSNVWHVGSGSTPSNGVLNASLTALWLDGTELSLYTVVNSAAVGPSSQTNLHLNGRPSDSVRNLNGAQALSVEWRRVLSGAEHKSFNENPWQLFQPLRRPIFIGNTGLQESFATYSGVSATSSIGVITAVGDGVNGSTSLTGIQLSSAVGSLTTTGGATTSIIGQQATSGRTAPTATTSATTTITGISITSSIGALTAQGSAIASLGGVSATSSVGILGVTTSAATTLSGVSSTSTVGIIGASANGSGSTTLVGVNSTSSIGTVTATGVRNATTTLTGVLSTSSVGSLNVSVSVGTTLGGVGSTSSVGVVTGTGVRNASTTLIGQSATSNRGIITAYSSAVVTLNGVVVNTAVGSLNISAGASTTLPSVLATVSVGNVNADGNFPYTVSLRYYYSEERNSVFTPESKNNVFISDSRTVETTPSPERNSVFVPASKNNVFAPDSRDVQTIPSPSRNQVFVSSTRTMVFISPKRDT